MKKISTIAAIFLGLGLSLLVSTIIKTGTATGKTSANVLPQNTPSSLHNQVIFVSDRTGNYDIYLMDLRTKKTTNLTNNPSDDMNPQVTHDGRFMAFYSNRDGDEEIYQMDLKTHHIKQLTNNTSDDFDPSYSYSLHEQYIVFKSTRDDNLGDIFIMKSDGSNQTNLTSSMKNTEEWDPTFSQDLGKIIFVTRVGHNDMQDELFTMDIDGTNTKKITNNNVPDWYPSVSLKDNRIAYISKSDTTSSDDIYSMTIDGKNKKRLTQLAGNDADPSWDLNGERIIFINDNDGDYDLYIMNADGSGIKKIQDTKSTELSPIFLQ